MELILWRHADAEDGTPDDARKLTARGIRQAERVAHWLRGRLPPGTRVLASPARRAQQTAQAFADVFETSPLVGTAASPQDVLRAAGFPQGEGTVLVVGHQPTLGQAAALILTGTGAEWRLRKGALWWFESDGATDVAVRAVIGPDLL
jgi:phosphohistidine phosphatase